jgi:hypothetical protein
MPIHSLTPLMPGSIQPGIPRFQSTKRRDAQSPRYADVTKTNYEMSSSSLPDFSNSAIISASSPSS